MGFLVRRSWSRQSDPSTWDRPVNQASKWLAARSGAQRILSEGGSVSVSNGSSRDFLLCVYVGDGGTANLGGTSGNNTVRISRTGTTISVAVTTTKGTNASTTMTSNAPFWSNVYVKCKPYGLLSDQLEITVMVDFNEVKTIMQSSTFLGDSITTNGKTLTCNSLSGWAWFAEKTPGFLWWSGSTSIPPDDTKYREAFLNNATWDVAGPNTTWTRPGGVKSLRAWVFQGGSGSGGDGGDGGDGGRGGKSSTGRGGTGGDGGDGGNGGKGGGVGGANGEGGKSGSNGSVGTGPTGASPGAGGSGGSGGSGGAGGAGGPGTMLQVVDPLQNSVQVSGGARGVRGVGGQDGSNGSNGSDGTSSAGNGTDGEDGKNGGPGGTGAHCTFASASTSSSTTYSNGATSYGLTTFTHKLGTSDQDGGVVFYYQW